MARLRSAAAVAACGALLAGPLGCGDRTAADPGRAADAPAARTAPAASTSARPVPRLVDVGAGKCIPCKAMAPILDQLRVDYAGRMDVVFIDVWKNPAVGEPYGIHMIPTQIFFAADGRELGRHEGFMSREDILARWKALGVEL